MDVASGLISADEAKIIKALALVNPGQLPERYNSLESEPVKCATELVRDAYLALLSNPDLAAMYRAPLESRPVLDTAYTSPLGYFRLHYDSTGSDAVPAGDTNSNMILDYIERAGELADSVWLYEVDQLGYLDPPGDGTLGGGEDVYDIYFRSMIPYGYTSPELAGARPWDDYSSFVVVSAQFPGAGPNDDPEGKIIGALKITLAHEFFHAIQFGYNVYAESYFQEMSSTWMEEMAYPVVNDNYQYLPLFFDDPQVGLNHDGDHSYASFIWPKYLQEKFGEQIMNDIWYRCIYNSAYSAVAYVLDTLGTSLGRQFAGFLDWNYLTGTRSASGLYDDAVDYPDVAVMRTHNVIPDSNYASLAPPEPLGANYIVIDNPGNLKGIFTFELDGAPTVNWTAGLLVDYGDGSYFDTVYTSFSNGAGRVYVQYFEDVQRVIVAPGVTSIFGTAYNYYYDIYMRPQGDADGNNIVNISDVTRVIGYIFGGAPGSHPLAAMDADCNRIINISDAVMIIQYIFGGGPAPCSD